MMDSPAAGESTPYPVRSAVRTRPGASSAGTGHTAPTAQPIGQWVHAAKPRRHGNVAIRRKPDDLPCSGPHHRLGVTVLVPAERHQVDSLAALLQTFGDFHQRTGPATRDPTGCARPAQSAQIRLGGADRHRAQGRRAGHRRVLQFGYSGADVLVAPHDSVTRVEHPGQTRPPVAARDRRRHAAFGTSVTSRREVPRSRPSPCSRRSGWRRNELRPEIVPHRVPQPGQLRKQFSCLHEIRIGVGAEGDDRRGIGHAVHRDDGDQMILQYPPGDAEAVGFGSDLIHLWPPIARAVGDHRRSTGRRPAPRGRLIVCHAPVVPRP